MPILKSFFKPLIFGLYFIFFFSQLNYISKYYYFSQTLGLYTSKINVGSKKSIVQADHNKKESKVQIKLNKRYYPKSPLEAPVNVSLPFPNSSVLKVERFAVTTPVLHFPPSSHFKRGPPFNS